MKFAFNYMKKYPGKLIGSLFGSLFFVAVTLGIPTILANIIDTAFVVGDRALLYRNIVYMVGLVLLGFIGQTISRYFISTLSSGITRDIRNDVFSKIQHLSQFEFQEFGVSSLSTRITTDAFMILQFTVIVMGMGLTAPLMIIFSSIMTISISAQLGLYVAPLILLIILVIVIIVKLSEPLSEKQQKDLDNINRLQRENITGLRVIRAFNREKFQEERFDEANSDYRNTSKSLFELMAYPQPIFFILMDIAIIILVIFGTRLIDQGAFQVGSLVAMIQYVMQGLFSFTLFSQIFQMYPRFQVSAERLKEVLDAKISVQNKVNPIMETDGSGTLEFKNVYFQYPDATEPVLKDISFKSTAGETLAFIGSTGSGKSTIIKLILRFYDVTSGQILLDGIDIRDLDIKVLREKIGYTPQKTTLFSGDINFNIKYGKEDALEEEIVGSTKTAQAYEFISGLDEGFSHVVSEGGSNFSGGQKQRLSIARTIVNDHEVYIFDDSFSALDFKTDSKVRQALNNETKDATTLIVGQRISSIMNSDQIIVLEKGEVAARGTHSELIENSELYLEIAKSQLTEEELKNA